MAKQSYNFAATQPLKTPSFTSNLQTMYVSSLPVSAAAAAANAIRADIMRLAHGIAERLPRRGKFAGRYAARLKRALPQAWEIQKDAPPASVVVDEPVAQLLETIAAISPYVCKKGDGLCDIHELYFGNVKAGQVLQIIRAAWEVNEHVPYLYPEKKAGASLTLDIREPGMFYSFYLNFNCVAGYTAQSLEEIDAFETQRRLLKLPHTEESYPVFEALIPLARREKLFTLAGVLSAP